MPQDLVDVVQGDAGKPARARHRGIGQHARVARLRAGRRANIEVLPPRAGGCAGWSTDHCHSGGSPRRARRGGRPSRRTVSTAVRAVGPSVRGHRAPRQFYGISPNLHTACPKWCGILLNCKYGIHRWTTNRDVVGNPAAAGVRTGRPRLRSSRAGRVPLHPGQLLERLPRPLVDISSVFRFRHRGGIEPALSLPARPGRHRAFGGAGSAHPVRVRLRRSRGTAGRSAGSGWRWTPWPTPRSFRRHPLDKISTSFTINGTAAILLAFTSRPPRRRVFRGEADRHHPERHPQGVRLARHLDLAARAVAATIADTIGFCAAEVPRFNAISVASAALPRRRHMRCKEMFVHTLADGVTCATPWSRRGPDDHRPVRAADLVLLLPHGGFFEGSREIPCRTAPLSHHRAQALRCRRQGGDVPVRLRVRRRVDCTPAGAEQPGPGGLRGAGLGLGGVQSMFTAAWDEPFALPGEESATLALRTQRSWPTRPGVTPGSRPLGVSYFVGR